MVFILEYFYSYYSSVLKNKIAKAETSAILIFALLILLSIDNSFRFSPVSHHSQIIYLKFNLYDMMFKCEINIFNFEYYSFVNGKLILIIKTRNSLYYYGNSKSIFLSTLTVSIDHRSGSIMA